MDDIGGGGALMEKALADPGWSDIIWLLHDLRRGSLLHAAQAGTRVWRTNYLGLQRFIETFIPLAHKYLTYKYYVNNLTIF